MITEHDVKIVEAIKKQIEDKATVSETEVDGEAIRQI